MNIQSLFSSWNSEITNTHLFIAAIVLACVLLAEVICIAALIIKLARARKLSRQEAQAENEEGGSYHHAVAPILLAALPQITYSTVSALIIAVAVASGVLIVMLIVVRAMGFDFVSRSARKQAKRIAEEHAVVDAYAEAAVADEADTVEEETVFEYESSDDYAVEEAQAQDAYVAAAQETFDSEPAYEHVEETEETAEEAVEETVAEEPIKTEEEAIPVMSGEVIAPAAPEVAPATTVARTTEQVAGDGQGPYKVVEKVVTETYKEVIKETPAPAAAETRSTTSADDVIEKLNNLLDYELEKRKAAAAGIAAMERNEDKLSAEDLDDEDEDDDEDELEETTDSADEDDVDDEENDISEDRFTGNERIIGFDETTGCYIVAHYRKSFEAKLIQSRHNIKKYYSELKNALLSYKGTKSRVSWTADSFHNGRAQIAKINVKTRILEIYLAIDPASLEGTVYRGKDVGSKKKYAETPFQYKVRTPRKFKWAMELVQRVCEEHGLSPIDIEPIAYDEQYPFDSTENLVARKLIKEYIRQEKPATTFELAEDHVPVVPDEDASVIPANANFSFELDNDMLADNEPEELEISVEEPVEEVIEEIAEETVEPAPAEEPAPAAEPAPASVYKETVKVTEMRYTERYYANGEPPVTTVVETTNAIEAPGVELDQLPSAQEISDELHAAVAEVADTEEVEAVEEPETVEESEEAEAAEDGKEHFFDDLGFDAEKFDGADPFEEYRGDDEETEEEVEYEEIIEYVDENGNVIENYEETGDEIEETVIEVEDAIEETEAEETEEAEEVEEVEEVEEEAAVAWVDDSESTAEEPEEIEYEEIVVYEEVEDGEIADGEEVEVVYEFVDDEAEEAPTSYRPVYARTAANPSNALIDLCTLEENFPSGTTINLDKLKEVGLVVPVAQTLNIYTSGAITKAFTVEANKFTIEAIKAIDDAGGSSVMLT